MGKRQPLLSMEDVDWPRTRAYAKTGMGQIIINLKGREPLGCVAPEDYHAVREEIIGKLRDLVDPETGEKVKGEIHRREEVYAGPLLELAPDITFLPQNNRYFAANMTGFMANKAFVTVSAFYGNHTMDGVFVGCGPLFRRGVRIEGASIVDLAPTILHMMDVPVLDGMDGRVLEDALTESFVEQNPVRYQKDQDEGPADPFQMSDEDREDVLKKLKALGYIG
jgi:predicted AlkP superfamily phosphohydrolase/phosphomutase